jgi:aspartyl-tRNA(Asn)/glutamyl-tRNA(Gln) amidotransferase subunit B
MMTDEILNKYEMTIGIECHVQLATATKLFSGADNDARDKSPNSVVSPIDFGLPGMLPILNREAVNLAIKAGKALNAPIAPVSRFDRKHYFYPDLPKGYQTTQMYNPIILAGYIDAPLEDGTSVRVRIHHAHMEEDAGKLTHYSDYSLVDLNRAGTPLIEIVSEPDIHSAAEAKAYASELHHLMTYAGVTRGDLYHGNMRFDVNVSVALKGAPELGTRAEVKNLNSFRSVEKAAEYEFRRQVGVLEKGEKVVQETRGWDDAKQTTSSQRSKEDAQDYRYMPDADIPPIILSDEEIASIQATVPLLPPAYREKWATLGLDRSVVDSLIANQSYAVLIAEIQDHAGDVIAKRVAHWFASALGGQDEETAIIASNFVPEGFVELAQMVEANELSSTAAKEVFIELLSSEKTPRQIAEAKNLLQVSDEGAIAAIVDEVLADPASAKAVEDIKNGNDKVIGFLVGQVMKKSQGKANPALAQKLIRERL